MENGYLFLILVNCELEVPESSKASKVKRILSRSKVIPRSWVPHKSSAVLTRRQESLDKPQAAQAQAVR